MWELKGDLSKFKDMKFLLKILVMLMHIHLGAIARVHTSVKGGLESINK